MQHMLRCISKYNAVNYRGYDYLLFLKVLSTSIGAPIAMNMLVYKV